MVVDMMALLAYVRLRRLMGQKEENQGEEVWHNIHHISFNSQQSLINFVTLSQNVARLLSSTGDGYWTSS